MVPKAEKKSRQSKESTKADKANKGKRKGKKSSKQAETKPAPRLLTQKEDPYTLASLRNDQDYIVPEKEVLAGFSYVSKPNKNTWFRTSPDTDCQLPTTVLSIEGYGGRKSETLFLVSKDFRIHVATHPSYVESIQQRTIYLAVDSNGQSFLIAGR